MKFNRGGILLIFITFITECFSVQVQPVFKHFSVDQRLPGSNVHAVYQDSKGLMWFAIESVGLVKYDGRNFTVFQHNYSDTLSLSNNFPLCMVEDDSGFLWVGTTEGLNRLNRNTEKFDRFYNTSEVVPNNYIMDLFKDDLGNLWISTRAGLCKYIPGTNTFTHLLIGEGDYTDGKPAIISDIYQDEKGNIWIGSYSSGLFLVSEVVNREHTLWQKGETDIASQLSISNYWKPIDTNVEKGNTTLAVQNICGYNEGKLLLGKYNGLYLFDINSGKTTKYQIDIPDLNNAAQSSFMKSNDGKIWVGYSTEGVLVIDPHDHSYQSFNANTETIYGLRGNTIRDVYQVRSGLIWVATKFQGLHVYDPRKEVFNRHEWNKYLDILPIKKGFVLSLHEDQNQNIWIGTKKNGAFCFNAKSKTYKQYTTTSAVPISNNRVECIAEDTEGNVWLGTQSGLNKICNGGKSALIIGDHFISCLTVDNNRGLWIGTHSSGIFYLAKGQKEYKRYTNSGEIVFFNDNTFGTRKLTITTDSLFWVATFQDGLYKYNFNSDKVTHYIHNPTDSNSVGVNMVRSIYEDFEGNIWVGAKSNGLFRYKKNTNGFDKVKQVNYLPPNTIYNIVQDKDSNFWMGTHEGLLCFNAKTDKYTLFNTMYGLTSNVFEINAYAVLSGGELIYGSSNGINVFDPRQVQKLKSDPPLVISSIKIYDQTIAKDIDKYMEFTVPYDDKYIAINFSLLDYSDPLRIRYKYILENVDNDWVDAGNRSFTSYTSLPAGEYLFKLKAMNTDGQWSEEPLVVKFVITSPFWKKTSFVIFCILSLLVLATAIYIVRLRLITRRERKLKILVDKKTMDLMRLNQELEKHKSNLEETVDKRTDELNKALKRAEESDELKSTFLANMSHEIRTPLNAIIGLGKILSNKIGQESENAKLSEMIGSNAKTLQQLIEDIIDISKIEANQIKIFKDAFPINQCISNVTEIYLQQARLYSEYTKVVIETDLPENDTYITSDQVRVEQILKNLINNALKFTKEGKVVVGYAIINKKNEGSFVRFYVKDTGIGIPENKIKLVFERFAKSETKENISKGGTGLGLSISYNLATLLGGKMWVESQKDIGSTFYFELPLEEQNELTKEALMASLQMDLDYNWANKTVLIVEDEHANTIILKNVLERTNIRILHAPDGESAIEIIMGDEGQNVDVILMDIKLPKMNGFAATNQIKKERPNIPVIAQTAFAMDHEEREILKSGFDSYISKPIDGVLLLHKMSKYI